MREICYKGVRRRPGSGFLMCRYRQKTAEDIMWRWGGWNGWTVGGDSCTVPSHSQSTTAMKIGVGLGVGID